MSKIPQIIQRNAFVWLVALGTVLIALHHWFLCHKFGVAIWAKAHDMKYYAIIARNVAEGHGFLRDAFHVSELKAGLTEIKGSTFFILHPWISSLLMRLEGDLSFWPVLHTSILYASVSFILLALLLKKWFAPVPAALLSFFFIMCPQVSQVSRIGLTELLMLLLLIAIANAYYSNFESWVVKAVLVGGLLGLMNLTRPTGMILFPAFVFFWIRNHGLKPAAFFVFTFCIVCLLGYWQESYATLHAVRFSNLTRETVGGPDFDWFDAVPKSGWETTLNYIGPVMEKICRYFLRMLTEPYLFFSDLWVFIPISFCLLSKRFTQWNVALVLAILTAVASVVGYWYEPRVTFHFSFFTFIMALLYFKYYPLTFTAKNKKMVAASALFFLLSAWVGGNWGRAVPQYLLAIFLVLAFIKFKTKRVFSEWAPYLSLGFCICYAIQSVRVHQKDHIAEKSRDTLPLSMQQLSQLPNLGDKLSVLIFSNTAHNVSWETGYQSTYIPNNLIETTDFFEKLQRKMYVIYTDKTPDTSELKVLSDGGFEKENYSTDAVWVFKKAKDKAQ